MESSGESRPFRWPRVVGLGVVGIGALLGWALLAPERPMQPVPAGIEVSAGERSAALGDDPTSGTDPAPAAARETVVPVAGRRSTAAAGGGRLRVQLRSVADGSPLPGAVVLGYCFEGGHALTGRTGSDGEVVFDPVVAGRYSLQVAPAETVLVAEGQESSRVFDLEPTLRISGRVVDAADRPVPGASVRVTDHHLAQSHSGEVARTDADGRFAWTSFAPGNWLFVSAAGFVPSPLIPLFVEPARSTDRELSVRLVRPAVVELSGRVVSAARREAIEGAQVMLLPPDQPAAVAVDGQPQEGSGIAPTRSTRADDQGRFSFDGLRSGAAHLWIRASGFGLLKVELDLQPPSAVGMQFMLEPPLALVGTVVDDAGEPIAGARLRTGEPGTLEVVHTVTGADGSFRLQPLPARAVQVAVSAEGHRHEFVQLQVPGGSSRLERRIVLEREWSLAGRLVDERDEPLGGWWLQSVQADGPRATTDADGGFDLDAREPPPELFAAPVADGPAYPPPVLQRVVRDPEPDAAGLWTWRIQEADSPSTLVVGRLRVGPEVEDPEVVLMLSRPAENWNNAWPLRLLPGPPAGRFEAGPFPPGAYELRIVPGSGESRIAGLDLGTVKWGAGERVDLGLVGLPAAVEVGLLVERPPGVRWRDLWLRLWELPGERAVPAALGAEGRFWSQPIGPGRYRLEIQGAGVLPWSRELSLQAGSPQQISCTLRPARSLLLTASADDVADDLPRWPRVRVEQRETAELLCRVAVPRSVLCGAGVRLGLPDGYHRIVLEELDLARPVDFVHGGDDRVHFQID